MPRKQSTDNTLSLAGRLAALAATATLTVTGCASQTQLGGGGSQYVSGSAGAAGSVGASSALAHCDQPLGTAALVEPEAYTLGILSNYGLHSPVPVLRLLMAQSNCFRVIDRGAAMTSIQAEDTLKQSGMLRSDSTTARGRMVTTQYLITPNVLFSNQNAGGMNALAGLGGLLGSAGALAGGVLGSMHFQEAQSALFLTDAQTGEQTAVAEGSAKVTDFGGLGGLGTLVGGIGGLGGVSGYGNTAEGKLVVAALVDAHNKLVQQVRATTPNLPPIQKPSS